MNVSSAAHLFGKIHFDNLQFSKSYSKWGAYGQSKLANILFTYELARRLPKHITANTLHPGMVNTELQRSDAPSLFCTEAHTACSYAYCIEQAWYDLPDSKILSQEVHKTWSS